jgi:signal peptidase II
MQTTEAAEAPPRKESAGPSRALIFWGTAIAVIVLDQLSKAVIRATLERGESWPDADWILKIRYVTNTGAAWGILEGQTLFLIVMATIGLAAIYLYYRNPPFDHWISAAAIGMLLGGALGNLIDRVRLGRVTDFVDPWRFPAFNVADSAITIGVVILIFGYLVFAERQHHQAAPNEDAAPDG